MQVTNYEYDYKTAYANQTQNGNVQTQLKSTVFQKTLTGGRYNESNLPYAGTLAVKMGGVGVLSKGAY